MTREEKIAAARVYRDRGLTQREIAERLGVAHPTVWKWLNPERAKELNRRDNAKRGTARWYNPCPHCGRRKNWNSERCEVCRLADDRAEAERRKRELVELWAEGLSARRIGEILGMSARSVYARVSQLRSEGWDLPVRNTGSQTWALAHPEHIVANRAQKLKVAA